MTTAFISFDPEKPIQYTDQEKKELAKSERKWLFGPVETALNYILADDTPESGYCVLDYGCGNHRSMLKRLRKRNLLENYGYDIDFPSTTLEGTYDVVTASNVLNIQPSVTHMSQVLSQIAHLSHEHLIFNYPSSPRRTLESNAQFISFLDDHPLNKKFHKLVLRHNGILVIARRKKESWD